MAADEYTTLLREFTAERSSWDKVGAWVANELEGLTKLRFTPALVSYRTKEPSSLVLKAHSKGRTDIDSFHDKVAARVALYYVDDVQDMVDAILERFDCPAGADDKFEELGDAQLGYRGVHCDVLLKDGTIEDVDALRGRKLWCEVQVHTIASALWAATGHPLSYKAVVTPELASRRAINALGALTEVYDNELVRVRDKIASQPEYRTGRVLVALERSYYSLFGIREHDAETSRVIVEALLAAFTDDEVDRIEVILRAFSEREAEQLDHIYRHNDPTRHNIPLLMQPEALLVFERLDANEPLLHRAWTGAGLPEQWYEDLASVWGTPLSIEIQP